MAQEFLITKDMIKTYCENGFTVNKMAEAITEASNTTCSPATIRKAAKHFGIDLKKKARPSVFKFEPNAKKEEVTAEEGFQS